MRITRPMLVAAILAFAMPAFAVERLAPREANLEVSAGGMVLIDIRTPDEWADTGVAPNATPIDMTSPEFVDQLKAVIAANPGKKYAFMCRSGNRSGMLTKRLEQAGLQNVVDVKGGILGWIDAGLPVKKP